MHALIILTGIFHKLARFASKGGIDWLLSGSEDGSKREGGREGGRERERDWVSVFHAHNTLSLSSFSLSLSLTCIFTDTIQIKDAFIFSVYTSAFLSYSTVGKTYCPLMCV
jgi:hypothetical protein